MVLWAQHETPTTDLKTRQEVQRAPTHRLRVRVHQCVYWEGRLRAQTKTGFGDPTLGRLVATQGLNLRTSRVQYPPVVRVRAWLHQITEDFQTEVRGGARPGFGPELPALLRAP